MKAIVVTTVNPFQPWTGQQRAMLRRPQRIRALAPKTQSPVIALLNNRPVLRAEWRRRLRNADVLEFRVLPLGGGGGGQGGSNPLTTVLGLAVLAFAPMAAAALLGTTTALVGSTLAGQLLTAGIGIGGQALISALIPVAPNGALNAAQASPTYSLQAQGNAARIEQPIPVQYGRMLFSPDFAAQPYTEFVGADQYLYQLFCIGQGEYSIEEIRIDDTPITSFAEITTEIVAPGGQLTLFPANVITSTEVSGQELLGMVAATYSQTGTTITVTETNHGRFSGQIVSLNVTSGTASGGVFAITGVTTNTWTVTAAASVSTSGNVSVRTVLGGVNGFVANPAGTIATRLSVDIVMPRGLFGTSGSTLTDMTATFVVQAQQIDDSGAAIGGWTTLGTESITDHSATPLRRSISYSLGTAGRYAVRAYRTDTKNTGANVGDDLNLASLRAYLQEPSSYGQVTLLAMRLKATNNLSLQASRLVRVLATRKLPIWNGSSWSAAMATRSIAWAFADVARNAVYGGRLPDARIDLAALLALDAVWSARGDALDGRFDQAGTLWDALIKIGAAGRAKPFMQGGILRLVRDDPNLLPVQMFSMRNIVKGSFSIDSLMPTADMPDSVQVSYFDGTSWAPQRVTCTLPGGTTANPAKVQLFGVTSRQQAQRDGTYLAACNTRRRNIVKFSTEMEGFIASIGDVIAVQHDTPGWGIEAEALAWNAATQTLTLSEPVSFDGVSTYYVGLRTKSGGVSGPWQVVAGKTAYDVVLMMPPDVTPNIGSEFERTHVAFGAANTWRAVCKILSAKPKGRYHVDIEAVVDDPTVYIAENGLIAPPISYSALPTKPAKPVVASFLAMIDPVNANQVYLSWPPAPGADSYQIEMAEGADPAATNATWTRIADTTATNIAVSLIAPYQTMIRIRGFGLIAGDWTAQALGSLLGRFWSTDPNAAVWTTGTDPFWRPL